jgi:hypothetical protein
MRTGNRTIKIAKERLIATVTDNRNEHRSQFLRAQEKYREKVIEVLDERLAAARAGDKINVTISLPVPQDYTCWYDKALVGLEWEVDDYVHLEQDEFNRLVLNDWEWRSAFAGTTMSYIGDDE